MAINNPPNYDDLGKAIENAFDPKEPVMIGAAISAAVTGTLTYLAFYGFIDSKTIGAIAGLLTIWIPLIGLVIRSQYTPYANREQ